MDGNGRWAQRQHLPRIEGHRRGVASVRRTVEEAGRLHLEQLPLHCPSSDNWERAARQALPRIGGHRRGVASVRRTVEEAARLHLEQLTLYCLSSENWKRPQRELDFLMHLLEQYMIEERSTIMRQNVVVR